MRNYVILQDSNGNEFLPVTSDNSVFVDNGSKKLINKLQEMNQTINQLENKIVQLESSKTEVVINSAEFVLVDGMYHKEITHNLNSEKIYLTAIKSDTKEGYFIGWKIIDKNRVLIISDRRENISVLILK